MPSILRLGPALILCFAIGCSDEETSSSSAAVSEDDFCRLVVQATCDGFTSCCSTADAQRYDSRSTCIAQEAVACRALVDSGAASNSQTFDGTAAAEVISALQTAANSCGDLPASAPPFTGTRLAFEACTVDDECAEGLWCRGALCVAPGGLGAGCDAISLPCAEDANLMCSPFPAGTVAPVAAVGPTATGTCISLPTLGQGCSGLCASDLVCKAPESALGVPAAVTTCQARNPDGMACVVADDCASRFCQPPDPVAPGPIAPALGAAGAAGFGGAPAVAPAPTSVCSACEINRNCAGAGDFSVCLDGVCQQVEDGTLEETDACAADSQCRSGHCIGGVCVVLTQDEIYCAPSGAQPVTLGDAVDTGAGGVSGTL